MEGVNNKHFWSAVKNALSATLMYISVFAGYLTIAFPIGQRLTTLQCLMATGQGLSREPTIASEIGPHLCQPYPQLTCRAV